MSRTTLVAVLSLLTGGLGGSVFTWFMNRPKSTIVTYNVVNTSTGSATTKSLIPNLKLQIGNEDVSFMSTHTIDLVVQSGPQVETARIAVRFADPFHAGVTKLRIYGLGAQAPSPLHHMDCSPGVDSVQCEIGPLTPGSHDKFRLSIATNEPHPEEVFTTTNRVELMKIEDYVGPDRGPTLFPYFFGGLAGIVLASLVSAIVHRS